MDLVNSHYWIRLSIGDIAEVVAGGTPKAGDPENFKEPGTGVPWLTPADLSRYSEMYIGLGSRDLSQKGYDSSSAKLLPKGSLLFSSRAPIGYVAIAKNDISTNQGFKNFVFPYGVNSRYAYYYLRSIRDVAERMGTGTTFKEISGTKAKTLPFLLPPLEEQAVIAEKLNNLLAQVETAKARLERIPEILKTFRQSVLAAAVSGKLTENWRGNANYMANKVTFGKLILSSSVGLVRSASDQHEDANGRYAYVKMNNIDNFWGHNIDNLKFVNASAEEISKYSLEKGDWLFNTRNSSELVGKSCVWQGKDGLLYNNNILRVKFKDSVLPEFIEIFIKSPKGQQLLNSIKSGTTNVAAIYQKQLFQLTIDMPCLYEQAEIVRRVQELFTVADRVEEKAKPALKGVNQLTQSILAKAFRGELTADWRAANPDLITGENSAESLLKKITTEQKKLLANKPRRRKRCDG